MSGCLHGTGMDGIDGGGRYQGEGRHGFWEEEALCSGSDERDLIRVRSTIDRSEPEWNGSD